MNPFVKAAGIWWLSGAKYSFSKSLMGSDWNVGVEAALNKHNLSLKDCHSLHDIDMYLRGKIFWIPDPMCQAWDVIYSPLEMLARGGDDCDGSAMFQAQAISQVMSAQGWKAYTVSYLADPFSESHHFAIGIDGQNQVWAMQPQPSKEQWAQDPRWASTHANPYSSVYGPYKTIDQTVKAISALYNVSVPWYTVRGSSFEVVAAPAGV